MLVNDEAKVINSDYIIEKIDEHFKVTAGPGAGKTYWLINQIKNVIRNSTRLNSVSKIACITYTNVAVEEIQSRLNLGSDRVDVSTIHSFLYKTIVKPYVHLIVDEDGRCEINYKLMDGHDDHIPSKGKIYLWKSLNKLTYIQDDKMLKSCLMDLDWIIEGDDLVLKPRKDYKRKIGKYSIKKESFPSYKQLYWNEGTLHHEDVLYFSYVILKKFPIICEFIAARYPYIYLDEFQDTSPIQAEIIKLLAAAGSTVGVIGDPAQSIFKFQGASRQHFMEFALPDQQNYKMVNNRRSTNNIIDLLNYIRGNDILKQEYYRGVDGAQVALINNNDITEIIRKYGEQRKLLELVGNYCMITSRNDSVTKLRNCKDECNFTIWDDIHEADPDRQRFVLCILSAQEYAANSRYEAAVKEILRVFKTDKENCLKEPFKNSIVQSQLLKRGYAISTLEYLVDKYPDFMDMTLFEFYNVIDSLFISFGLALKKVSGRGAFRVLSETILMKDLVNSLKVKEEKVGNIRTIHKAKGAEFQSVLVYVDDAKDIGKILSPRIDGEEDDCRLYYVALSRAEDFLCIATNELSPDELSKIEKLNIRVI